MPTLVRSEEKTFRELTQSTSRLTVPFLQRNYVWQTIHFSKILEDIETYIGVNRRHFTGSIITADTDTEDEHLQLIDGQQRLTTLVIICKAVKDCMELWRAVAAQDGVDAQEIQRILYTEYRYSGEDMRFEDIVNNVFGGNINNIVHDKKFLTLKSNDGRRLEWILEHRTVGQINNSKLRFHPKGPPATGYPRIYRAYDAIFKSLSEGLELNDDNTGLFWYGKNDPEDENEQEAVHVNDLERCANIFERLVKILDVANNKLLFLKMHVIESEYIYDIFNTVNSLGHKLSRFDLLRNTIVQRIDMLQLQHEEKQNLIDILLSFSDDEVVDESIVSNFVELYANVKLGNFSKSSIDEYWGNWIEHNFVNYQGALDALEDVYKDLIFFKNLVKGEFETPEPEVEVTDYSILNNKLNWINYATVKLHLPLLLNGYLSNKSPQELEELLKFSEKVYIYWRIYMKKLPQKTKNLINNSINGKMHKDDCGCRVCTNQGPENQNPPSTIKWDEDEFEDIMEFMESKIFTDVDLDKMKVDLKSKNDYSTGLSKFLLWNIESKLVDSWNAHPDNELAEPQNLVHNKEWEQEHIMPKRGTPAIWGDYAQGTDLNLNNLEKIGNHTLFWKVGNIKLGNKSWGFKRQHLPTNDAQVKLNHDQNYCQQENWTENEINTRSAHLVDHITSIWFE